MKCSAQVVCDTSCFWNKMQPLATWKGASQSTTLHGSVLHCSGVGDVQKIWASTIQKRAFVSFLLKKLCIFFVTIFIYSSACMFQSARVETLHNSNKITKLCLHFARHGKVPQFKGISWQKHIKQARKCRVPPKGIRSQVQQISQLRQEQ